MFPDIIAGVDYTEIVHELVPAVEQNIVSFLPADVASLLKVRDSCQVLASRRRCFSVRTQAGQHGV